MDMNTFFDPQDAPASKWGAAYVTIDGNRYSFFNAKKCEVKASVETKDVPVLGRTIKGKKAVGMEVKITMTVYKCSEHFDDIVEKFKNTGVLPTFDLQVSSEDPASAMGRTSKIYNNCVIDGDVLLSMFEADGDVIEQEITAYAMDYSSAAKYKAPDYM